MAKNKKNYLDEYLENEDFQYDIKSDPLYQAMKKQYLKEADRTAEDVLGKYAQISGGGAASSAAVTAASQAANLQKDKLNNALPELYDLAWDIYSEELENKRKKYQSVLDYDKFIFDTYGVENPNYYKGEEDENIGENGNDGNITDQKPTSNSSATVPTPFEDGSNGKKAMDKTTFSLTEKLIKSLVAAGNRQGALNYIEDFRNSMSQDQISALKKIING